MGFFSDLKEDLSQAVNELMPPVDMPEKPPAKAADEKPPIEPTVEKPSVDTAVEEPMGRPQRSEDVSLEEMLKNIEDIQVPEDMRLTDEDMPETEASESVEMTAVQETEAAEEAGETEAADSEDAFQEDMLAGALEAISDDEEDETSQI